MQQFLATLVLLCGVALTLSEHPVTSFVRHISGKNPNQAITDDDIIRTFAIELHPKYFPAVKQRFGSIPLEWYRRRTTSNARQEGDLTETPSQVHVTVTTDTTQLTALWATSFLSTSAAACWWPEGKREDQMCVNGTSWTYDPISILPWIGTLHGVTLTGLVPSATYCYIVGNPLFPTTSIFWTNASTCFAAPNLYGTDTITVALGGDMGSIQLFGFLVANRMYQDSLTTNFDAFWLLGDIAYSTLDPPKLNFEFFWDIFMDQEAPLVNHVPLMVTFGNHDFSGGDSGAYVNRFRNPQGGQGNGNFYWSYTHGPVFFVSMCTEIALNPKECTYAPGTAQYLWLEQQLASINRTKTPWLVLGGHRPMYSSDKSTDSGPLQHDIEPLLKKYQVDVELSGHMHVTEVIAPVFNNTPYMSGVEQISPNSWLFSSPQAPVHFTVGNLGAMIADEFVDPQPPWSLFRSGTLFDNAYGYTRLVANRTALHFTMVKQSDGSTMWDVMITK